MSEEPFEGGYREGVLDCGVIILRYTTKELDDYLEATIRCPGCGKNLSALVDYIIDPDGDGTDLMLPDDDKIEAVILGYIERNDWIEGDEGYYCSVDCIKRKGEPPYHPPRPQEL